MEKGWTVAGGVNGGGYGSDSMLLIKTYVGLFLINPYMKHIIDIYRYT